MPGNGETGDDPDDKVTVLYPFNHRDAPATLRAIADEIERGTHGDVGTVSVVVLGAQMRVFGCGPEATPADVALLLHAGFSYLSRAVEEHGRNG